MKCYEAHHGECRTIHTIAQQTQGKPCHRGNRSIPDFQPFLQGKARYLGMTLGCQRRCYLRITLLLTFHLRYNMRVWVMTVLTVVSYTRFYFGWLKLIADGLFPLPDRQSLRTTQNSKIQPYTKKFDKKT